jgi:hypothetical protein
MYKDMCNDVRRLVAVYIISIPIERALSGRTESAADFTQDLINDLLSLVFYYEMAKRFPVVQNTEHKTLIKSGTLLVVNDYLTNSSVNVYKCFVAMCLSLAFNYVAKPVINTVKEKKGIDLSNFEDSLETVVMLSVANNSIYDTLAKAISLFLFNYAFKW